MPFDPSTARPVAQGSGKFDPSTAKPVNNASDIFGAGVSEGQPEQDNNSGLQGIPAVAVEAGRGLERGVGQTIADAGYLANAGGLAKNPIGSGIQNFGLELIKKSKEIPDTNIPDFVKGTANFAGELAPMLATFGTGEAIGLAKLGEGGMTLLSQASKSERLASALTSMIRPMGQATLMGVTSALDTASTLPDTMEFNQKVNEIYNSGKVGFIVGGVGTVLMDKGLDVLRNHGEKAFKAFNIAMYGSQQYADKAMDLTRTQGSYDQIKVDPSKPYDQRISLEGTMANELSPIQREEKHKAMTDAMDAEVRQIGDENISAKNKLGASIAQTNQQFSMAQSQIKSEIEDAYKLKSTAGESKIEGNITKIRQLNTQKLDALEQGNIQRLNQSVGASDQYITKTVDMLNANKDMNYGTVSEHDPAGGFNVDGMISKIKSYLKQSHNIDLVKESPMQNLGEASDVVNQAGRQAFQKRLIAEGLGKPPIWTAKANNTANIIPPDAKKLVDFLTGDKGYLKRLEELKGTNSGKISLDMLQNDSRLIKQMSYDAESRTTNSALAGLDATIRPNRLVGDVMNANDKGHWIGSSDSLAMLKEAAIHDKAIADVLNQQQLIQKNFIGNQEFTANVVSKVKALLNNPEGYNSLRQFEDSIQLEANSSLRLTNSFKEYSNTSDMILQNRKRLSTALSQAIDNQKLNLNMALDKLKRGEIEGLINARYANKEALILKQQAAYNERVATLRQATDFQNQLKEKISLENKDRERAANEIATLGSYSTGMGKLQRGMMMGSAYGALSGSPHTAVSLAVALALTPKTYTSMARGLKAFAQSSAGKAVGGGVRLATRNKLAQQALLGSLIRKVKSTSF